MQWENEKGRYWIKLSVNIIHVKEEMHIIIKSQILGLLLYLRSPLSQIFPSCLKKWARWAHAGSALGLHLAWLSMVWRGFGGLSVA